MRIALITLFLCLSWLTRALEFSKSTLSYKEQRIEFITNNIFPLTDTGLSFLTDYQTSHPESKVTFGKTKDNRPFSFNYLHEIILSDRLIGASDEYLSWILMMALVEHKIMKETSIKFETPLPKLVESDFVIFTFSMKFLNELTLADETYVINSSTDLAWSNTTDYAREKRLSMTKFFGLWSIDKEKFITAVLLRCRALNYNILTIEEYLESGRPTERQRRAAIVLEDFWEQISPLQNQF